MQKQVFGVIAAALVAGLFSVPRESASALTAGRVDPCSDAMTWGKRVAKPAGQASLEGLATAERACASTFTRLAEACPHALKAGDAYTALASRQKHEDAPTIATTIDFALAYDAYSYAATACRGSARAVAVKGAEAAARHVRSDR